MRLHGDFKKFVGTNVFTVESPASDLQIVESVLSL